MTGPVIVCLETRRVHALNASEYAEGKVFGWRDDTSPTGFLSGVVVSTGPMFVEVSHIAPAVITWNR